MTWTHYLLVFQLKSPLHIGWRKVGNLMQTRRYVPGKVLWGALTARLVRMAGQGNDKFAYQQVGEALTSCFRFSYLWPARATQDKNTWTPPTRPHFPWSKPDSVYWDYLYLNGTARTALEASEHVASEGMLHQIEYIAPYTREGQPVYLVGDLWVKEDLEQCIADHLRGNSLVGQVQDWEDALNSLQLGGERGYGWGKVRLLSCLRAPKVSWGEGWKWEEREKNGKIEVSLSTEKEQEVLPTHVLAMDFSPPTKEGSPSGEVKEKAVSGVEGPIEPWVGWEHTPKGYRISIARILYEPGAKARSNFQGMMHAWGYLHS